MRLSEGMILSCLVEGYGEVEAMPTLLRRLSAQMDRHDIVFKKGFRVNRPKLTDPASLSTLLEAVTVTQRSDRILVVFDSDDDCPVEMHERLAAVCRSHRIPAALALPVREFEAWILAGYPVTHPDVPTDPERPRDAKGVLGKLLNGGMYSPTAHQSKLAARIDLTKAAAQSRSFRHLEDALSSLIAPR